MKFATFTDKGRTAYGAVTDNGVIDLSSRHADQWPTLKHVIEDAALTHLTDLAATLTPDFDSTEITYQIPIPNPEKSSASASTSLTATRNTKTAKTRLPSCRYFPASPGHSQATINP